jgi:hypothetical protein
MSNKLGDDGAFVLFKGGGSFGVAQPEGGLDIGRHSRPAELEPIGEPASRSRQVPECGRLSDCPKEAD